MGYLCLKIWAEGGFDNMTVLQFVSPIPFFSPVLSHHILVVYYIQSLNSQLFCVVVIVVYVCVMMLIVETCQV